MSSFLDISRDSPGLQMFSLGTLEGCTFRAFGCSNATWILFPEGAVEPLYVSSRSECEFRCCANVTYFSSLTSMSSALHSRRLRIGDLCKN